MVLLLSGLPTSALANHFDVLFYEVGGQLATGVNDFGPPSALLPDVRVFVEPLPVGDLTTGPGFTAGAPPEAGNAPPGNVDIEFDVLPEPLLGGRTLSRWDLTGDASFEDPEGVQIRIKEGSCLTCATVFVDGGTERIPGFTLGTTTPTGTLHRHHQFWLLPPAGSGDLAPAGAYLLALAARVEGLLESPPFYVLFGKQASAAQLEAAASWVEDVLLVPEPGATASGVAALLVLAGISRQRGKKVRRTLNGRQKWMARSPAPRRRRHPEAKLRRRLPTLRKTHDSVGEDLGRRVSPPPGLSPVLSRR